MSWHVAGILACLAFAALSLACVIAGSRHGSWPRRRNLAAGYASIGVPVEVIPGHTHRYAVRERVRWDRAYLVWRKQFMQQRAVR